MNVEHATSRCWLTIDLDALGENYESARLRAKPAFVIPVIKADAYGCGAAAVARKLRGMGARLFAVATVSEALYVKSRVDCDVLVLGMPGDALVEKCIEEGVILTAYSRQSAMLYSSLALKLGKICRVHIKLNTGLNRLGFDETDEEALIDSAGLPGLKVEGVYTHLALHDAKSDEGQFRVFDRMSGLINAPIKHVLDSIGLFEYPDRLLDAVRIGAYLYGVDPKSDIEETSKSVVSFYARVVQTRLVKKGELVGYDDYNPLTRDSVVATISAGYVDGYPRKSDISQVEIAGSRAKVLGIACMDQMMADVTDIPNVSPGDVVTLLGGGISLREFSSWWDLNRNEAISRIGARTPRVYKEKSRGLFLDE